MLRGWRGVMGTTAVTGIALAGFLAGWGDAPAAQHQPGGLRVHNGWLCHGDDLVWGWIQHNGWWRPGQRPNLCRRSVGDPEGDVRPNRTEDLVRARYADRVVGSMFEGRGSVTDASLEEMLGQ